MQLASSNYSSNTRGDSPAAAVVVPSARNTTEWPIFAAPKLCPLDRSCSSLRSNERNEEEPFSSSVKQLNLDRLLFLPLPPPPFDPPTFHHGSNNNVQLSVVSDLSVAGDASPVQGGREKKIDEGRIRGEEEKQERYRLPIV